MKTIIFLVKFFLICSAGNLNNNDSVKPSGVPQFIHSAISDLENKPSIDFISAPIDADKPKFEYISSRPQYDYISSFPSFGQRYPFRPVSSLSFGNIPYLSQSGYQTGYQYIRNIRPPVLQQRHPIISSYPLQETYYPTYRYDSLYPQFGSSLLDLSYLPIIPYKK